MAEFLTLGKADNFSSFPVPYELFLSFWKFGLWILLLFYSLWGGRWQRGSNYTSINWQCVTAKGDGISIHVPEKTK